MIAVAATVPIRAFGVAHHNDGTKRSVRTVEAIWWILAGDSRCYILGLNGMLEHARFGGRGATRPYHAEVFRPQTR
jgi:hypothetical protein